MSAHGELPTNVFSQSSPEPPQHESVVQDLSEVKDDPPRFRSRIAAWKPFAETTPLPEVFRAFDDIRDAEVTTFLCLLTSCLPAWFARTRLKKSDRSDQPSKKIPNADADLEWLLQLILAYVTLTYSSLTNESINKVVDDITKFCLKATTEREVTYAIEILYELSQRVPLPSEEVRQIAAVLAAAAKAIHETPEPLEAYYHFLVTGDAKETCLQELQRIIAIPNRQNDLRGLLQARGACRLFGAAVDYQDAVGAYVIDLANLVNTLQMTAAQEIFRFGTDILYACECMLASTPRRTEVLNKHLAEIVAITLSCLKLQPPDDSETSSNSALPQPVLSIPIMESTSVRPKLERQVVNRMAQAQLVSQQLDLVWDQLEQEQKVVVNDYVLQYPRFNVESLVLRCLKFTSTEELCDPGKPNWGQRLHWLQSRFIKDTQVFSSCRAGAVNALSAVIHANSKQPSMAAAAVPVDAAGQESVVVTRRVLRTMHEQLPQETDWTVLQALADAIPAVLAAVVANDRNDLGSQETIGSMEKQVMEGTKQPEVAAKITSALVHIFRELFNSHPKQSLLALESLVNLAGTDCKFSEARLEAMRLLVRIRSTSSGQIYLAGHVESEYVAIMLCRTKESKAELTLEPQPQRESASSSLSSSSGPTGWSWMYESELELEEPGLEPSKIITSDKLDVGGSSGLLRLDIGAWLTQAATCLRTDTTWETYSYILVHLGSQLSNVRLFRHSLAAVAKLRQVIHEQIVNDSFVGPPLWTGLTKPDVALCLFNILTPLIAYVSIDDVQIDKSHFGRQLVQSFMAGMVEQKFDGAFRGCVHALSVCSLEVPEQVGREYPGILDKMAKVTTKSHWAVHMLEFLSQVAILPEVHKYFSPEDRRMVFSICIAVLNDKRDDQLRQQDAQESGPNLGASQASRAATPSRLSGLSRRRPPYRAQMMEDAGVPRYASALAYHTMICWFLSLSLQERPVYAKEIVRKLVWRNKHNEAMIDQQAEVFRDMMLRTTYSDLGETQPDISFSKESAGGVSSNDDHKAAPSLEETDGKIESASWLVGYSIVTIETAGHSGRTQVTKRQASGTTYATYQQSTRPLPPHQAPLTTAIVENGLSIEMLPEHVMLQLQVTAAPMGFDEQPIRLPNDEAVSRALRIFDLNATMDSHKAGVLFVGPGQAQQAEIMSNASGSPAFEGLLAGLGYRVSLQPPCRLINPQGLRYPSDGKETIAWCDRVTEMVFLVPTMMPLDTDEEQEWMRRWANVGNSYVNIIFNQSDRAWRLENLQSQFNYVNIVITPADRNDGPIDTPVPSSDICYQVQVVTKEGFPNISPAADPKLVSASQLPRFVRVLAISACVFSQAWEKKDEDREFHSPWRDRLIAIKELRKKYAGAPGQQESSQKTASGAQAASTSATSGRRTPVPREDVSTGQNANDLISRLDFMGWMGLKALPERGK